MATIRSDMSRRHVEQRERTRMRRSLRRVRATRARSWLALSLDLEHNLVGGSWYEPIQGLTTDLCRTAKANLFSAVRTVDLNRDDVTFAILIQDLEVWLIIQAARLLASKHRIEFIASQLARFDGHSRHPFHLSEPQDCSLNSHLHRRRHTQYT